MFLGQEIKLKEKKLSVKKKLPKKKLRINQEKRLRNLILPANHLMAKKKDFGEYFADVRIVMTQRLKIECYKTI